MEGVRRLVVPVLTATVITLPSAMKAKCRLSGLQLKALVILQGLRVIWRRAPPKGLTLKSWTIPASSFISIAI